MHFAFPASAPACTFWLAAILAILPLRLCADDLTERHAVLERVYAAQLEQLAVRCEKDGLAEQAAATRAWIKPSQPLTIVVAVPTESPNSEPAAEGPAGEWLSRLRELRQAQAKSLYELARAAADEDELALAYQWMHAVLREDPQHEAARKLLGFKLHDGKWLTQYEYNKARSSQVWHPRFGWLARKHLARYEAGERFLNNRWISADDEARLHADIDHAREIGTEHFQLRTDCSLEEGVELAARLEEFYGVWRQVFISFLFSDQQLLRLFREGKPLVRRSRPHQVTFYRDRKEYNAALVHEYPNIDATHGFYLPKARTAYFYSDREHDDENVYHEVTHQLFYEANSVPDTGAKANFWVVEGVACFVESYRRAEHLAVLGGLDAWRLKNARVRLLRDDFYIGLADLSGLGMQELQNHDQIKEVYSQAAGMTYFLMFAADGRYRRPLVDYLTTVYANRDRPDTLSELTGTSFSKLDEQYQHFIRNLP